MTSVVIPYLHRLSQGDEIKRALRSWEKHAQFDFEPVIVGDKPTWYTGKHIPTIPVRGKKFARAFDIATKITLVASSDLVTEDFIYSYLWFRWLQEFCCFFTIDRRQKLPLNRCNSS